MRLGVQVKSRVYGHLQSPPRATSPPSASPNKPPSHRSSPHSALKQQHMRSPRPAAAAPSPASSSHYAPQVRPCASSVVRNQVGEKMSTPKLVRMSDRRAATCVQNTGCDCFIRMCTDEQVARMEKARCGLLGSYDTYFVTLHEGFQVYLVQR